MQVLKTDNIEFYQAMIKAAIVGGLTFQAYLLNDEYIIEYKGGF